MIIIILCNTNNCIKNPYLLAKYVEVLFTSCPMVQPHTKYFNDLLINFPFAEKSLVSALMKFYAGKRLMDSLGPKGTLVQGLSF